MKTTTIIIAAALTLSVNVLFAGNELNSAPVTSVNTTIILMLAPTVPMEANFEDTVDMTDFASLAPTTPMEAQFEDISNEMLSALNLAPVTPVIADFEEFVDLGDLAPVVPAEADFE